MRMRCVEVERKRFRLLLTAALNTKCDAVSCSRQTLLLTAVLASVLIIHPVSLTQDETLPKTCSVFRLKLNSEQNDFPLSINLLDIFRCSLQSRLFEYVHSF